MQNFQELMWKREYKEVILSLHFSIASFNMGLELLAMESAITHAGIAYITL